MSKNSVVVRTAADLERKYNFASLLGLKKNVELTAQGMQKIENELSSMLNALVINLKDVLDSQSEISLWFYSGIPTTSNEPFISWGNPNEHKGDIYYDQSTGKVYQWNGLWEVNTYPDLVEAMAITNAEIDTTTDHERKVFFDTPTIPYSNGDWWIKEDGRLFICQISKTTGTYEEIDFINSNAYTESYAEKIGEELKVLKGTVTTISENYAKFTDLATGGSTTIAGENITTGNIQSNNYIQNETGMKIALTNGTIDSKNFKTDIEGNVYLGEGAKVIGGDGLLTNLQFQSASGNTPLGWYYEDSYHKMGLDITYSIPSNFKVEKAYVSLFHVPCYARLSESSGIHYYWGYSQSIKLYKLKNDNLYFNKYGWLGTPYFGDITDTEEIANAFGENGFTADTPSSTSHKPQFVNTIDISSHLKTGENGILVLKTSEGTPSSVASSLQKTGQAFAVLNVIGYMSFE